MFSFENLVLRRNETKIIRLKEFVHLKSNFKIKESKIF